MYNRYISGRQGDEEFVPAASSLSELERSLQPQSNHAPVAKTDEEHQEAVAASSSRGLLGNLFGKKKGKSGGLFDGLFGGLKNLDIGDIILLLIIILLVLEEDDMDFLIILGLVFLLGI
ncbi:MAG: hypothetical protein ACOX1Q_01435 [Eubacteriales bacterium]